MNTVTMESIRRDNGKRRLFEKDPVEYTEWVARAIKRGYRIERGNAANALRFYGPENEKCDFRVYFDV